MVISIYSLSLIPFFALGKYNFSKKRFLPQKRNCKTAYFLSFIS